MRPIPRLAPAFAVAFATSISLGAPALHAQVAGRRGGTAAAPRLDLPPIEARKLANGIEVAVMRDTARAVSIGVVLDVGPAADPADKPGLGDFVKAMLNLGTMSRTAEQIADAASRLRSRATSTFLYAPVGSLDKALPLLADQLLHPAFDQAMLDQLKANATANLRRTKDDPRFVAASAFKAILYGAEHPYARRQTEASIASITRDDVLAHYVKYICPPNVRFAVVGDISADSAAAKLNRYFGTWETGSSAKAEVAPPKAPARTTIYLYDQPEAARSMLWVGGVGARRDAPDYAAISVMNTVLGGSIRSRLNMSLRREHRYTQDVQSGFAFYPVPEPGAFAALAAVEAAETDSALVALMRELRDIRDARPITTEEFQAALLQMRTQLPLELSTGPQRLAGIMDLLSNNLPLDYFETLGAKLAAMTQAEVQAAAQARITPDRFAIVVVGDRRVVEAPLRAAKLAPVVVVDRNGKPVGSP